MHGCSVDVLVGGEDLTFPHHAYQAAMVSAVSEVTPFAHAVLHVGEVRISGEKMAKSTGNLVLVDELLSTCSPAALRLLLLSHPYSEAWNFEHDQLDDAERRLQRLYALRPEQRKRIPATSWPRSAPTLTYRPPWRWAEEDGGDAARRAIAVLRLG